MTQTDITTGHDCNPHHPHDCEAWVSQEGEATADYCGCQCGHCETWTSIAVDCMVCGKIGPDNAHCNDCGEVVCPDHL